MMISLNGQVEVYMRTVGPQKREAQRCYSKKSGNSIRHIGKQTLEHLRGYHWPGNIRELQNVVERAVILGETDTFVVMRAGSKANLENHPKEKAFRLGRS